MTTVPDHIKKNVRAVLLSKVGGILVSDFCKDYKSLLREQLNWKQLGFNNLNELIKALPDVVRLEFSEKDLAYKMFGLHDPNSTYTPLSAKIAAESSPDKTDKRSNSGSKRSFKTASNLNGDYDNFLPNMRGHYTLCYPRFKDNDDVTKESLEERYGVFPGLFEVHMIPKMIFLRYTDKESAIKCLEKYKDLTMRIAEEKNPKGSAQNKSAQKDDLIISRKKANSKNDSENTDDNEVYIGNLDSTVTKDDVEELCSEFSPASVRIRTAKNDSRKVFAFVNFNDQASAQQCVQKLDRMNHKGRTLNARIASKDPPPQGQQRSRREPEEPSAPVSGKVSWRSGGDQKSNGTGISALEDDEEAWDSAPVNKVSWKSAVSEKKESSIQQGKSSFGQNTSSFGNNTSSFSQTTSSFGQSTSSFGQNMSSFGNSTSSATSGPPSRNNDSTEPVTLYFGNLHSSVTQEDLADLVKDLSPAEVRLKNNDRKVFGFVVLNSKSAVDQCVEKFDQMEYKGRKILCRISSDSKPKPKDTQTAQSGGSKSWGSVGNKNKQNGTINSLDNNDNSWDAENKNSQKTDRGQNDISARLSGLSIQTGDSYQCSESAISPAQQRQNMMSPGQYRTSQKNQSPQKQHQSFNSSSQNRSPRKPPGTDFSDMPPLEPRKPPVPDFSDMPPLEPAIVEEMPPLEPITNSHVVNVWVANFSYFETEDDLMALFGPFGAVDITMYNSTNTTKTTGAIIHFPDEKTADDAILQTHQMIYKERLLWVEIYESNPDKRSNTGGVNLSICVGAGRDGSRSVSLASAKPSVGMKGAGSCESVKSTASTGTVGKNFRNLMHTYKIIMNKLGTRVRDVSFLPHEEIMIYITSVFDDNSFWGQIVKDDNTIAELENVLEQLDGPDVQIGRTKGLGRCVAKIDGEWFRCWVVADRGDFNIEVFNVDYGNTAIINKRDASLTVPHVWDLQPAVRPFRIKEGTHLVDKTMEQTLVYAQVTSCNIDDTGFLTEVQITGQP